MVISASLPSISQAQTYTALEPLPCIPGGGVTCPGGAGNLQSTFSFQNYVQFIFNLIIAIAAATAVFMIVFGGLQYMTTDSWQNKSEGLDKVKNALYGLLLILTSYLILRTIDPRLVAIPTTLVTPLKIDYTKYATTADYFNMLDRQANSQLDMLKETNKKILADVTTARTQVASLETRKTDLENQIRFLKGDTDTTETDEAGINRLCSRGDNLKQTNDLCVERQRVIDQINTQKIQIALKVGSGVMNDEILKCAAGAIFDTCRDAIFNFKTKYNNQLGDLSNDPTIKNKLDDYAGYATVMAYAHNQILLAIDSGSLTPVQAAIQALGTGMVTVVGGATGGAFGFAASGGVAGGAGVVAGGNVAQSAMTSLLTALNNARKTNYASTAINNIRNNVLMTIASIRDPQLKQVAQSQIDSIIASLGSNSPQTQDFVTAGQSIVLYNAAKIEIQQALTILSDCLTNNGQGCDNINSTIDDLIQPYLAKLPADGRQLLTSYGNVYKASAKLAYNIRTRMVAPKTFTMLTNAQKETISTSVTRMNSAITAYARLPNKNAADLAEMQRIQNSLIDSLNQKGASFTTSL